MYAKEDFINQEIRITVSNVGIGAAVELSIKPGLPTHDESKDFIVKTLAAMLTQLAPEAVSPEFRPTEEDVLLRHITGE